MSDTDKRIETQLVVISICILNLENERLNIIYRKLSIHPSLSIPYIF